MKDKALYDEMMLILNVDFQQYIFWTYVEDEQKLFEALWRL